MRNLTRRHEGTKKAGKTCILLAAASLCLCGLLLSGCQRKIKEENLQVLRPEMTTKEVESILGAPTRIEVGPELVTREVKTLPKTRYVYEQNGKKIELDFIGDRLAEGAPNPTGKPLPAIEGKLDK